MAVTELRKDLVPSDEALRIILEAANSPETEIVRLKQARNRILGQDLAALRTQPPFDASAMDGYGVIGADLGTIPARLKVIGESAAGHPYTKTVSPGQAVRIFTGGVVPKGVDTIVIQENTQRCSGEVTVLSPAIPGKYIRKAGMDFKSGEILLQCGDLLDPAKLSLAASMNHAQISVFKRPKVALLATGDELVAPGSKLDEGKIIASNSYGIGALVEAAGGTVLDLGIAADTKQSLEDHAKEALNANVQIIVTMGGASVGDHDLVKPVFSELGFDFVFEKIAMRPGKPLLFAIRDDGETPCILLGLAGNPVSSIVAGSRFLRPLIQKLAGYPSKAIIPVSAILDCDLPENDEREEYMRSTYQVDSKGNMKVTPFKKQDSSMLAALVKANCLMIRPKRAPAAFKGDPCKIIML